MERQVSRGKDGYYFGQWDGKEIRYPSVTTALGFLTDFSMIQPDILQRACDFGTAVHNTIELYEKDTLDRENLDPILEKILKAWERCKSSHKIEVELAEPAIVSSIYRYAGRLDIVAQVRGVRSVIEIKSRPYSSITEPLQTAAYLQAYNESYPKEKARKRYFCGFTVEGNYSFFEIKKIPLQPDHLNVFLSALALYKWKGVAK